MKLSTSKAVILLLGIWILSGCANSYQANAIKTPPTKISANSKFYVTQPKDGVYGNTNYAGSGKMTSAAIAAELSKKGSEVVVAETVETVEQAKQKATTASADYLFVSKILHWEDRATEWSLLSDKITMNYVIYDTHSGEKIASTTASATSGLATFGGDHPQDLVPKTVEDFLKEVMH
ncbi:DUF4823 domain-containing protein [Sneathiella litorea]|uniref:DUF4823 domain-containing protein n=1 Tax=Sneathiella litorea TaxID=2606216 RepID=A0A6L8WBI0_9PROT|nr:DUF4823 domain-containing protein [Sneathiella litorea]MZR31487.1 DUF4823 domain-containing protein [Sneathiella litorea]